MIVPYTLATTKDKMSAQGGALALVKLMERLDFPALVDRLLPKPESNSGFPPSLYLVTFVLMLNLGYFRLSYVDRLQADEVLRSALGVRKFPSASSLGNWLHEKGVMECVLEGLEKLNQHLVDAAARRSNKARKVNGRVTLDIDATLIFSRKEGAEGTYIGPQGYSVMFGHIAETGQIVFLEFRQGNVPPAKGIIEVIKECERQLPAWMSLGLVRFDAAGFQKKVIRYLQSRGIPWVTRAPRRQALVEKAENLPEEVWKHRKGPGGRKIRREWVARCEHTIGGGGEPFTVVMQRSLRFGVDGEELDDASDAGAHKTDQYVYRFVATSRSELSDSAIVRCYNLRGEHSENRIKEYKSDFGGDTLPCTNFHANALYSLLVGIAYNLYALFRKLMPPGSRKRRVTTCRAMLYQTAAKVVRHGGRLFVKVSEKDYALVSRALELMEAFEPPPLPA